MFEGGSPLSTGALAFGCRWKTTWAETPANVSREARKPVAVYGANVCATTRSHLLFPLYPLHWPRGILLKEPSRCTLSTSRIAAHAPPRMFRPRTRDYLLEELVALASPPILPISVSFSMCSAIGEVRMHGSRATCLL